MAAVVIPTPAEFLDDNPLLNARLRALSLEVQGKLQQRLLNSLAGLTTGRHVKYEGVYPPVLITTLALVSLDLDARITMEESPYHKPGNCEPNFDTLAVVLTGFLAQNQLQQAIDQLRRCLDMRARYNAAHPQRPGDVGHTAVIAFLDALLVDLQRLVGDTSQQQVSLYQYAKERGGTAVYNFVVEAADGTPIKTANPPYTTDTAAAKTDVARYEAIKLARIGADPNYIAAVTRAEADRRARNAAAGPGGRRTRRRRAFKRRSKQSRRRVSRRA
jgi:hypothetical protein